MTIKELVKLMSDNKYKMMKQEQLQDMLKKKLEVKDYVSFATKRNLVNSIVNECVLYENGMFKFNDIDKYVCFTMRVIEAYTNLEVSSNLETDYDLLCESKMLEFVINTFKKEYDDVNILLQMQCDYVLSNNSIGSQIGRFLDGILDKVDVLVDTFANKADSFDFNKLPVDREDLNKLMQFISMQK